MISQQINLYQERFREKRLVMSFGQLMALLVIIVVGMGGYSVFLEINYRDAVSANQEIKLNRESMTAELKSANEELVVLLADNSIDLEISHVTREVSARKRVLRFVESNQFGSGQGFSESLVALSRLSASNLWLNEIKLTENFISIKGSALKAASVPVYFSQFSDESVFNGKRFDHFKVNRSQSTVWKVDFEIATKGSADE
ncbi:MAG: hypothetical protein ACI845_000358 [Gammaproteobacteria bacterium]